MPIFGKKKNLKQPNLTPQGSEKVFEEILKISKLNEDKNLEVQDAN